MQGGYKLKIPTLLLNEKEKTRNRFGQVRGIGSNHGDACKLQLHLVPRVHTHVTHLTCACVIFQMRKREHSTTEAAMEPPEEEEVEEEVHSSCCDEEEVEEEEEEEVMRTEEDAMVDDSAVAAATSTTSAESSPPAAESKKATRAAASGVSAPSKQRSSGGGGGTPSTAGSSRLSLCRRVTAVVMGVIVPIGKKRKGLNRSRVCLGGGGASGGSSRKEDTSGLPSKVSFVFTERDALRRLVQRMMRECPKTCRQGSKEDFLVTLLDLLDEERETLAK